MTGSPCIIVGLGNPGREYERTRHNLGFDVVEQCATLLKCGWQAGKGDYLVAEPPDSRGQLVFAKPMTYMNRSGSAVADLVERYGIQLTRLLIVLDDLALPLGSLRMRPRGSDGGHNGLSSIIYSLASDDFPRLRCGIGGTEMPVKERVPEFVLSPFDASEKEVVEDMIAKAADACMVFVNHGIEQAMNKFNT